MQICKECGVELDDAMTACPLCGASALTEENGGNTPGSSTPKPRLLVQPDEKYLLQRILWQVTSIFLLSGIVATLIIDFAIHGSITWSVYPVSICMIIFSYASVLALWHARIVPQLLVGWLISTIFLFVSNLLLTNSLWTIKLGIPILFTINLITILLITIVNSLKTKGLNVFALIFVAVAVQCIAIEGIVSFYLISTIHFQWSIIVAACLLPVIAALFFMYFRTRKNAELQKIFHT